MFIIIYKQISNLLKFLGQIILVGSNPKFAVAELCCGELILKSDVKNTKMPKMLFSQIIS